MLQTTGNGREGNILPGHTPSHQCRSCDVYIYDSAKEYGSQLTCATYVGAQSTERSSKYPAVEDNSSCVLMH